MMRFNELQQCKDELKQDRSEDRALWHSEKNCRWHRTGRRCANLLLPVAEIRRKPVDDLPAIKDHNDSIAVAEACHCRRCQMLPTG